MFDSEPADEFVRRPQGSSCLILGMMGVVSVFLAVVIMAVVGSVLFPDFGKLGDHILRHFQPRRFVLGINFMPKGGGLGVENQSNSRGGKKKEI